MFRGYFTAYGKNFIKTLLFFPQLKQFRMPPHNFRPIQDMNHRFVLHNTDSVSWSKSSAIAAPTPFTILALASLLVAFGLHY